MAARNLESLVLRGVSVVGDGKAVELRAVPMRPISGCRWSHSRCDTRRLTAGRSKPNLRSSMIATRIGMRLMLLRGPVGPVVMLGSSGVEAPRGSRGGLSHWDGPSPRAARRPPGRRHAPGALPPRLPSEPPARLNRRSVAGRQTARGRPCLRGIGQRSARFRPGDPEGRDPEHGWQIRAVRSNREDGRLTSGFPRASLSRISQQSSAISTASPDT